MMRRLHSGRDLLRVAVALLLGLELLLLAGAELRLFQLRQRSLERFHAVLFLLVFPHKPAILAVVDDEGLIGRIHPGEQRLIVLPARRIQEEQVVLAVHQELALMLAMNVHQESRHFPERAHGHHQPAHAAEVAPRAGDFAVEGHHAVEILNGLRCGPCGDLFVPAGVKDRLHPGLVRARADQVAVGAPAQHQVHRVHHDGFARAGFARHHVQTVAELQRQLLNQRNVVHAHG